MGDGEGIVHSTLSIRLLAAETDPDKREALKRQFPDHEAELQEREQKNAATKAERPTCASASGGCRRASPSWRLSIHQGCCDGMGTQAHARLTHR
jgi:hypothetical protein